mmetsp:Transcript_36522/g.67541  ORF Transcript_36522/g.67541 Transcript_36522/m.67541 type:complete len:201 (-) Transcript_36522:423-1025(-)
MLFAELFDFRHVPSIRNNNTCLPLDGLDHKSCNICTITLEFSFQLSHVVVPHTGKPRHVWAEASVSSRIVRGRNRCKRAPPEVVSCENDTCLIFRNSLHIISPPPRKLDRSLSAFNPSIHGKDSIIAKVISDELNIATKAVVVKCPTRESKVLGLFHKGTNDLGVAMALIDGGIRREKVKVACAINIPHFRALALRKDHW